MRYAQPASRANTFSCDLRAFSAEVRILGFLLNIISPRFIKKPPRPALLHQLYRIRRDFATAIIRGENLHSCMIIRGENLHLAAIIRGENLHILLTFRE
jgi:hypothetical protein